MTTRSRYTAAITDKPWWLAGGIPQSACIAAYQAIGASSLSASYTNLATPGIYNCAVQNQAPTFASTVGWTFNGTDQVLTTGWTPPADQNTTMIIRISGADVTAQRYISSIRCATGSYTIYLSADGYFGARNRTAAATVESVSLSNTACVLAMSGNYTYRDGIRKDNISLAYITSDFLAGGLFIGAHNSTAAGSVWYKGNIQSYAIYSYALTHDNIVALTNAMNAL